MSQTNYIPSILEIIDRFNRPQKNPGLYKEWQHFCVIDQKNQLRVIVNFNVSGDVWQKNGNGIGRLILVVMEENRPFRGDVLTFYPDEHELIVRDLYLRFGENVLTFEQNRYRLKIEIPRLSISMDLTFNPLSVPLQIRNNTPLGSGYLNWLLVPRLETEGKISIDDRHYWVDLQPGYHDHNWGRWRWGDDFSWEWGFAVADQSDPEMLPYTVVYDRTTNRARNTVKEQTLCLWNNLDLHKIFTRRDITVQTEGFFPYVKKKKLPRVMNLITVENTHEIPQRMFVDAANVGNWLQAEFQPKEVAQIVVPNDVDLENTMISEVFGRFKMEAWIKENPIHFNGYGFFEFLT